MGFFTSSSTAKTEHYNPILDTYTQGYRSFSPFAFQSTDPMAFLQAYAQAEGAGEGGKFGKEGLYKGYTPEAKKAAEEQAAIEKQDRQSASDLLKRSTSGEFLAPDQMKMVDSLVNKAYEYEESRMMEQFKKGASELAGSRGLRMTDTAIARPMMQQLGMAQLGISSQRAGAKLQTGMQLKQFEEGVRQFQQNLEYNRWSSRLNWMYGGGAQAASQVKYTDSTKGTRNLSGFQQLSGSLGLAMGVASFAMGGASQNPQMMQSGMQGTTAAGNVGA